MEIAGNKFGDVGGMNHCDGSSVRMLKLHDGEALGTMHHQSRWPGRVLDCACFDVARF